jgi:hypothetical protein
MRNFLFASALALSAYIPTAAMAQPAPQPPAAIYEPTQVVARLLQVLTDPHVAASIPLYQSDVAPLLQALNNCANIQLGSEDSKACPVVAQVLAQAKTEPAKPAAGPKAPRHRAPPTP